MKLRGRATGMGAETRVRLTHEHNSNVTIKEYNFSRSGNHWDIEVEGDGIIDIIDITNSGKHGCARVQIKDGEIIKTLLAPQCSFWDTPCPICEKDEVGQ